jgi:type III secretion protein C
MRGAARAIGAVALALAVSLNAPAEAGSRVAGLPTKTFVYKASGLPLLDLLRDFAGAQAIPLVIADGVTGVVNADFRLKPTEFLDVVSKAFGLIWYFDGVALYVYPSSDIQTRLFKLGARMSPQAIEAALASFGLGDVRYPMRYQRGMDLALVFGPPRHIELVEEIIGALSEMEDPMALRAFRLTYAPAADRTVQGERMRGMASTLSAIYQDQQPGAAGGSTVDFRTSLDRLQAIDGTAEQRAARDEATQQAGRKLTGGGAKPATPAGKAGRAPGAWAATERALNSQGTRFVFTADEATNTVIVRGPADQMAGIESLIQRLDVPGEMIEIEATIIDIASDEAQALGFDWRYQSNSRDVRIAPTPGSADTGSSAGFNITTLYRGSAWEFLARIRALESRGSARVVSQPKVLGAVNRTALLSDKRTASVRVAGNQDAQLFSVEAGTSLQVTPRLILAAAQTQIGMELLIEDGGFSAENVDGVPVVQRTTIRTDATLVEGQSLLVGGIVVESRNSGRSAVPWLGQLPLIGPAFRTDESGASRRQRMFLLTPKRIALSARDAAPMVPPESDGQPANAPHQADDGTTQVSPP